MASSHPLRVSSVTTGCGTLLQCHMMLNHSRNNFVLLRMFLWMGDGGWGRNPCWWKHGVLETLQSLSFWGSLERQFHSQHPPSSWASGTNCQCKPTVSVCLLPKSGYISKTWCKSWPSPERLKTWRFVYFSIMKDSKLNFGLKKVPKDMIVGLIFFL